MNSNERERLQQALSLFERGIYHLRRVLELDPHDDELFPESRRTQNSWEAPMYSGLDVGTVKSQALLDEIRVLPTKKRSPQEKQKNAIRQWRMAAEKKWKSKIAAKVRKARSQKKGT